MNKQLTGTSGTYFVMSFLASKGFHASCTLGNAPFVDVLVGAINGSKSICLQVKTTMRAKRTKGRGQRKVVSELQFPLGEKYGKISRTNYYFAFVDLNDYEELPDVYFVSSKFVKNHCRKFVNKVKWLRFHINIKKLEPFKNNWKIIQNALQT